MAAIKVQNAIAALLQETALSTVDKLALFLGERIELDEDMQSYFTQFKEQLTTELNAAAKADAKAERKAERKAAKKDGAEKTKRPASAYNKFISAMMAELRASGKTGNLMGEATAAWKNLSEEDKEAIRREHAQQAQDSSDASSDSSENSEKPSKPAKVPKAKEEKPQKEKKEEVPVLLEVVKHLQASNLPKEEITKAKTAITRFTTALLKAGALPSDTEILLKLDNAMDKKVAEKKLSQEAYEIIQEKVWEVKETQENSEDVVVNEEDTQEDTQEAESDYE
jgi:hypothetical protein